MDTHPLHVVVVESDPTIAQAIAGVALDALPPEAETIIAKSASVPSAKRLLDRILPVAQGPVILVCALELADGGRGLEVLAYARERHPGARVVLVTNGEREELARAIDHAVDAVVAKPDALRPLRAILQHLARDPPPLVARRVAVSEGRELRHAVAAVEAALEAVERAHDDLQKATGPTAAAARQSLAEAEHLAMELHRRMLDVARRLDAAPDARG